MKRLALTLMAGAFGTLLVLPMARAENYKEASKQDYRIHRDNRDIHHDERMEHKDLRDGKDRAARREQAQINEQTAKERNTEENLRNNIDH